MNTGETAFPHRFEFWDLPILAQWSDPHESERNIRWARDTWATLQPHRDRDVYVKNLGEDDAVRVGAAYITSRATPTRNQKAPVRQPGLESDV